MIFVTSSAEDRIEMSLPVAESFTWGNYLACDVPPSLDSSGYLKKKVTKIRLDNEARLFSVQMYIKEQHELVHRSLIVKFHIVKKEKVSQGTNWTARA